MPANEASRPRTIATQCFDILAEGPTTTPELSEATGYPKRAVVLALSRHPKRAMRRPFEQTTLWLLPEHAAAWGVVRQVAKPRQASYAIPPPTHQPTQEPKQ